MAKMFYSLDEAAAKLGKSADEVRKMAESGRLQEFRDRDKLMFKVDQVDLLADEDGGGLIPLADSGGASGLALELEDSSPGVGSAGGGFSGGGASGSGGIEIDEPKERSGISIFDTESTEDGDSAAVTRITSTGMGGPAGELNLESVGSGSGLLDLTREGDDTSLGADLLEDVYKPEDENAVGAAAGDTTGSSGLFESTSAASDVSGGGLAAPAMAMMAPEPYDGTWSGIGGGLAAGAGLIATVALAAVIMGVIESADNPIVDLVSGNFMMWIGIFAGVLLIFAVVGLLIGRKT